MISDLILLLLLRFLFKFSMAWRLLPSRPISIRLFLKVNDCNVMLPVSEFLASELNVPKDSASKKINPLLLRPVPLFNSFSFCSICTRGLIIFLLFGKAVLYIFSIFAFVMLFSSFIYFSFINNNHSKTIISLISLVTGRHFLIIIR